MATLRPIHDTISIEKALSLILAAATPIERIETVDIREAHGRVVAGEVTSAIDVPPFDRAAMDGYAVIAEDTFGSSTFEPRMLRCIETVFTGQVPHEKVTRGTCIEIATGAPLPEGADAVVMVEETEKAPSGDVLVMTPVYPRQHVGRRAADIATGQTLFTSGDVLTPSRIGALAAIGVTNVRVFAQPRVAILSTGNEIVDPGTPLAAAQLYDINQFTLSAIVAGHGGVARVYPTTADTLPELVAAISATRDDDVLVFSGGSSVGERDLVIDAIGALGEVIFHGIAVKPGKPTAFGRIDGRPIFGMPGYPTSCLSNAYMLLLPMLRRIARLPAYQPHSVRLPLTRRVVSTTGRHQFYTVRIEGNAAVPAFKASGDITSMAQADGYIEIPAQTDIVEAGEIVEVKLF